MNTSQSKDHFSYIRGRKVHALFTNINAVNKHTIRGFRKTTASINKALADLKIPLDFAIFTLKNIDGDGFPTGAETLYVTYNGNIQPDMINLLYLEYSNRLMGIELDQTTIE